MFLSASSLRLPPAIKLLASATAHASSDSNLELVLCSAAVIVAAAAIGFIPIQIARRKRHRSAEAILTVTLLWGLLLCSSASYCIMQQMDWTMTYQQRLETGVSDPRDVSDKPALPIALWCGLGVVYVGLLAWAARGKKST